jgi:hypothetical protein
VTVLEEQMVMLPLVLSEGKIGSAVEDGTKADRLMSFIESKQSGIAVTEREIGTFLANRLG